tara:strand:+ start:142 stop:708 length:567 start_codon:yes stop_codon:yes gene_type:complete
VQTIEVPIDDQILAQLDELVPVISDSDAVRELGMVVTRATVARLALVRGLRSQNLAPPPPGAPKDSAPTTTTHSKAPDNDATPTVVEVTEEVELDNAGMIRSPEGWNRWKESERIPESHTDIHSYYDRQGWRRYWGRAGDETMVFYWSPDPTLQDVIAYDGQDVSGKTIKIQETPYGPGHIVPHGWSV